MAEFVKEKKLEKQSCASSEHETSEEKELKKKISSVVDKALAKNKAQDHSSRYDKSDYSSNDMNDVI